MSRSWVSVTVDATDEDSFRESMQREFSRRWPTPTILWPDSDNPVACENVPGDDHCKRECVRPTKRRDGFGHTIFVPMAKEKIQREFDTTVLRARSLAAACGRGWIGVVHENMGWHYFAKSACGRMEVHDYKPHGPGFSASLSGQFSTHPIGKSLASPAAAIQQCLAMVERERERLRELVEPPIQYGKRAAEKRPAKRRRASISDLRATEGDAVAQS